MEKRKELTDPTSCMSRANEDEMTFVLLGRDVSAPHAVRCWVADRLFKQKNEPGDATIVEALGWANKVEELQAAGTARGSIVTPIPPKAYVQFDPPMAEDQVTGWGIVGKGLGYCAPELTGFLGNIEGFKPVAGTVYRVSIEPVVGDELLALEKDDPTICECRNSHAFHDLGLDAKPIASDETR